MNGPQSPATSFDDTGERLHALVAELYSINRSITGEGVRQSLRLLRERATIPLELHEVPTGTSVFDWTIPNEWNVREAYVIGPAGDRVIDIADHSLHLVGYSTPIRVTQPLAELRRHLHSLPDKPDLIPYRTSYYSASWGFCLSEDSAASLPEGDYQVVIDATLAPGSLTYGECFIPGESEDEVLFSAHCCHPSLANDNCSGMALAAELARVLMLRRRRRYSFRFIWAPGTIGAIAWLARNQHGAAKRIKHGLILSCVGDDRVFTYKRSRRGDATIDKAVAHVLETAGKPRRLIDFSPYGYDERQYCSPGFDLPVGLFMRSMYGTFPEYHTSADDLSLVTPAALAESLTTVLDVIEILEHDRTLLNAAPFCEPQLGRRGLYGAVGGQSRPKEFELAMLWILNQSDGTKSLLEIAAKARLPFPALAHAAEALEKAGLVRPVVSGA